MKRSQYILLCLAVIVSACGKTSLSWKEEVKLSSGELIVVQRTAKTKAFGEVAGPGGWENEGMTVELVSQSADRNPPVWNFPFVPLLMDRDPTSGQWFIVATFYSCVSWYALERPKLPYTEYRVVGGQWVQQALTPNLIGRSANMLTSIRSSGEPDHSIASKESIMNDPRISKKYKSIVSQWSTGC